MAEGAMVRLSPEVYKVLSELADERGCSIEQLLSDAVGLEVAVGEARRNGGRLLVETQQGRVQEFA